MKRPGAISSHAGDSVVSTAAPSGPGISSSFFVSFMAIQLWNKRFAERAERHTKSGHNRLDFDFPALGCRHACTVGRLAHQLAGRRAVGDEDQAGRDFAFLAEKD